MFDNHFFDKYEHWYMCDCGATDYFEAHNFSAWAIDVPATAAQDGLRSRACSDCAYREEQTIPANHEHVPGDWIIDQWATADADGSKHKECTICGEILDTQAIPATGPAHEHAYPDEWSADANRHWRVCECGYPGWGDYHKLSDWIIDVEATETSAGSKHRECTVCGYLMGTETIPMLVTYTYQITEGANGTWTQGSAEGARFVIDADLSQFLGVGVNGAPLDASDYSALAGSVVITLTPAYLNALETGKLDIEFSFTDATVGTTLTIAGAASGDESGSNGSSTGSGNGNGSGNSGAGEIPGDNLPPTGEIGVRVPVAALALFLLASLAAVIQRKKKKQSF